MLESSEFCRERAAIERKAASAATLLFVRQRHIALAIVDGSFWADGHLQVDVTDERGLSLAALMINGYESPASGKRFDASRSA
jgi:hypothetical protein